MPLKSDNEEEPSINLTPMIDVVFLLIIFFMVGSQFTKKVDPEIDYTIALPTVSDLQPLTDRPDPITINITDEGKTIVFGGALTAKGFECNDAQLEAFLKQLKKKDRQTNFDHSVIIRGDGKGKYQRIMDVIGMVKQAKFNKLTLAAKPVKIE